MFGYKKLGLAFEKSDLTEEIERKCWKCNEISPLEKFTPNKNCLNGREGVCKKCQNAKKREKYNNDSEYRANKNKVATERMKKRYWSNKKYREDMKRAWRDKYASNPEFRENISERKKEYMKDPEKRSMHNKNKRRWERLNRKNLKVRLHNNIRSSIWKGLRHNKNGMSWESLVGYTTKDLMKRLEKQFTDGMNWGNYGIGGWHVDHKIPVSVFNFTKPEHRDFKRCWALKNLQPLWASDNCAKNNKLKKPFQPSLLI